jgi:hypothetical protein
LKQQHEGKTAKRVSDVVDLSETIFLLAERNIYCFLRDAVRRKEEREIRLFTWILE